MDIGRLLWVVGGYLAGTFPSTWLVATARGSGAVLAAAGRGAGETDAHVVIKRHLGIGWAAVAATSDISKGLLFTAAGRWWGHLPPAWLALVGLAVVAGHAFPLYARRMAGRGLSAAAGVLLILLPIEMVVAGMLILSGFLARVGGVVSTVALAGVPLIAAIQGQPGPFVALGAAIFVLVLLRRLEGVRAVIRSGVNP